MNKLDSPIEKIEWINPEELNANSYNPNFVFDAEMKLLELSVTKIGWIQPVLITKDKEIIDGFHRVQIAKKNKWQVPCATIDITKSEQKLLTIRINRAKGTHIAVKMAELIQSLIKEGVTREQIAKEIGATMDEIKLLETENIFQKFDFKKYTYSKAWIPK